MVHQPIEVEVSQTSSEEFQLLNKLTALLLTDSLVLIVT